MNGKVFLIYPPSRPIIREDRCQTLVEDAVIFPLLPPTDLMYMAAVAETAGCECKIVDYTLDNLSVDDFINGLKGFNPDYLVISATTPALNEDLEICSVAKELLPGIKTIAKGAHFLRFSRKVLEDFPALDMVIRGETEIALKEILSGRDRNEIAGLTWRNGNNIIENPEQQFIEDLDSLPFPARHLIDNSRYIRPDNNKVQGVIKVSRGCPYNCFFCLATPVSGAKLRLRSPENIIREIRLCIEQYNIKDFIFWSDIFNLNKDWVMELCHTIIDSGLRFNWAANTRVDTINPAMAKHMRQAGCRLVSVGIESGNQEILDKIGKGITKDHIREAFHIFKEAKLKTLAYYLIGLPWETRETVEDTIRFAIELDSDYASFFIATPLPGTTFFEYALENGLFDAGAAKGSELRGGACYMPVVKGHCLSKDEIVGFQREAVRRFYLRPRYIAKRLLSLHSWRELFNYSRAALAIFRS